MPLESDYFYILWEVFSLMIAAMYFLIFLKLNEEMKAMNKILYIWIIVA